MTSHSSDSNPTLAALAALTDIWGLEVAVIGPGLAGMFARKNGQLKLHHLGSMATSDPESKVVGIPFAEFYMLRFMSQQAQVPHAFYVEGKARTLNYIRFPPNSGLIYPPVPDPARGVVVAIPKAEFAPVKAKS